MAPTATAKLHYLMADEWNSMSTNLLLWRYKENTEQTERHAEPRACVKTSLPVLNEFQLLYGGS